ncbi:hypothetical protein [Neotamlana laminarinivorans]|uniref:Uncharacterized protein n=1 Tax=Neotamlana laminarinivorans TaxID=2883124 RepID=A0A9X1HW09_9FLAO|nr:hypothetical protein [Tamlana laminarinivorans]MCB4797213.1 hypothetical protein [Tamlana laminarinivorans]
MIQQLKTLILFKKRFIGIELTTNTHKDIYHFSVLKKVKNTLDIVNTGTCNTKEELNTAGIFKKPFYLVINTKQVLTKPITHGKHLNAEELIHQVFPNIDLESFYYEISQPKHLQHALVSICRKTYVNDIINELTSLNLHPFSVSLGHTHLINYSEFIEDPFIYTSNSKINLHTSPLLEITSNPSKAYSYNINGLSSSSKHILSLFSALHLYLGLHDVLSNLTVLNSTLYNRFSRERFLNVFLKSSLGFILLSLLLNFLIFNHYFQKNNHLEQTLQVNEASKTKLLELNAQVEKSKVMIDDVLKSKVSKSSFYINAITTSLPSSILLRELNYQPLQKTIKVNRPIAVHYGSVLVFGDSHSSNAFSQWINTLENLEWVKQLEILHYSDQNKNHSSFGIKILINDK